MVEASLDGLATICVQVKDLPFLLNSKTLNMRWYRSAQKTFLKTKYVAIPGQKIYFRFKEVMKTTDIVRLTGCITEIQSTRP